jgi:YVTN family beta-propeller protein
LGENSLGGSSPSAVLAAGGRVFVSNAGNDSISVIDPGTNQVEAEIPLRIPGLETLRGVVPSGLAYHEKSGWLLVAEAGINAVGVIDPRARRVLGHLPAAWFPTRIAIHQDTAYVANARGHGEGPNARGYVPYDQQGQGTLSVFPLPAEGEIAEFTAFVLHANGFDVRPAPDPPLPAAVKHVVLIVKSSRSYDEMLGGIARVSNGAVMGAPGLARFGLQGYADGRGARLSLKAVAIAPNQQAIARQWAFSDNFYADSDTAVDGHHWIAGAYPNLWSESSLIAAASDQKKDFRVAEAPGRLSFPGSDASVHPEDVSEGGTIWHHFARHGVSFYSFGEGFQLAGASDGPALEPTGVRLLTNVPMPDPLYRNTSQTYPAFNMNIPDQYRASQFIQQVEAKYGKGGEAFPQFVFLHLPNDYGAAARPADGFPYRESFIADNDYALARILEYLSGTPWWKEMAVFITEDSSQGGVDHIDANRTLLLCAGPWIKRNYVSHANTSFPGLLKTIFRLLKLPPLNLFDAAARDLSECFTSEPDYSVYKTLPPDTRVFDAAALQQIISGSSGSAVAGKTPK